MYVSVCVACRGQKLPLELAFWKFWELNFCMSTQTDFCMSSRYFSLSLDSSVPGIHDKEMTKCELSFLKPGPHWHCP